MITIKEIQEQETDQLGWLIMRWIMIRSSDRACFAFFMDNDPIVSELES